MSSWFCCDCGDGPHSSTLVGACTTCGHQLCSGCSVESAHYSHATSTHNSCPTTTATDAYTVPTTTSLFNAPADASASPISYFDTVDGSLNVRASHDHGHTHGTQQPRRRPEGGPVQYRWTCCNCGFDNSYEYDAGCSSCNNHWREGCCNVWQVPVSQ